jgi:hypothetical protein
MDSKGNVTVLGSTAGPAIARCLRLIVLLILGIAVIWKGHPSNLVDLFKTILRFL